MIKQCWVQLRNTTPKISTCNQLLTGSLLWDLCCPDVLGASLRVCAHSTGMLIRLALFMPLVGEPVGLHLSGLDMATAAARLGWKRPS